MPRKKRPAATSRSKGKKGKAPDRVIFTDLDGTLLDHDTYSAKAAEPALKMAARMGVPVVFCTSKTRAEIEAFRKSLGNRHPFIAENGEVIYIPRGYFRERHIKLKSKGDYLVKELGRPYKELRQAIKSMQKKGLKVRGFGDMSLKELMDHTGLSEKDAKLAKQREYDEPFILEDPKQEGKVREFAKKQGLQLTKGGRFHHLLANNSKGLAVKILTGIYSLEAEKPVISVGLGDSENDIPLLQAVDVPYLVKRPDGKHVTKTGLFIPVDGIGPKGWNSAVTRFLEEET